MKIKVLFENSKIKGNFKEGHGLSIMIIDSEKKYLFDTGANKKLLYNASELNETLQDLEGIIISHGHSDHTGGLKYLQFENTKVYVAKEMEVPHYLKVLSKFLYVGMPKSEVNKLNNKKYVVKNRTEIAPTFHLIPLGKSAVITKNLYKEVKNEIVHDDFEDELMLVVEQEDGLIVFTGCSHHGIVDMMEEAFSLFPGKDIKYLIGGFHMIGIPYINNLGMSEKEVFEIGEKLNNPRVKKILTCHCTGKKAFRLLKRQLGDKLEEIHTGQVMDLL